MRVKHLLKRILGRTTSPNDDASVGITDQMIIEAFKANPNNTFLVSFPRTGSHWLRMIMELYFGRPSLVRIFYYPERRDYLTLHTHDLELDVVRTHVIYLYREPVDTIYSQLQYHKENIDDRERIAYWSDLYGRHLDKWLHRETFTKKKTVVRYEWLKDDLPGEFAKICVHFDEPLDVARLQAAAAQVTKEQVKQKTPHDPRVINLNRTYEEERRRFRAEHGDFVWQVLLHGREHLRQDFRDQHNVGTSRSSPPTQKTDNPIQFTGIVVTYNEARHLRNCLNSLAFCEQLLIVDLGSTDASVKIARECGAEVVHRERVPVVEQIREEAVSYARNDWVILLDPDEVLPTGIEQDLCSLIDKDSNIGSIRIPWQFYFRGRPLHHTIWGRNRSKSVVHHKKRVRFSANVHRGIQLLEGYTTVALPRQSADYYIKHYWVDSYRELFEKHWRYIQHEGESRYNSGQRFSWRTMLMDTARALKRNLINFGGLRGGFTGVFLSCFYSWYVFMSWLSLWKYERTTAPRDK